MDSYTDDVEFMTTRRGMPASFRYLERMRLRGTLRCSRCRQSIAPACAVSVSHDVSGFHAYHPSCRERADVAKQPPAAPAARNVCAVAHAAPQVIGTIAGVAAPIATTGWHRGPGGGFHELYERGCFAESIRAGGQRLDVAHGDLKISGVFQFFQELYDLRFRFSVHDSQVGRQVLDRVRKGELGQCSIRFRPVRKALDPSGYVTRVQEAELLEVSLVQRGSWRGTRAWVE